MEEVEEVTDSNLGTIPLLGAEDHHQTNHLSLVRVRAAKIGAHGSLTRGDSITLDRLSQLRRANTLARTVSSERACA